MPRYKHNIHLSLRGVEQKDLNDILQFFPRI